MTAPAATALREANRRFYDRLWSGTRLVRAERFNTWGPVADLLADRPDAARLEVGPGLRPRLPVAGTHVLDISPPALARLRDAGARAVLGDASDLPFVDAAFDLVAALDVIEHVEDDVAAVGELARVARPGAVLLLSVPLHSARWTGFDAVVGHRRRYDPPALCALLDGAGFAIRQSAVFGMQPRAGLLVGLGTWFLVNQPHRALWWYDRVLMPLGLRRQAPLALRDGLAGTAGIDEILLLCHRLPTPQATDAITQGIENASQPA